MVGQLIAIFIVRDIMSEVANLLHALFVCSVIAWHGCCSLPYTDVRCGLLSGAMAFNCCDFKSIIVHSVVLDYRTCIMTGYSVIIVCFDLTGGAYRCTVLKCGLAVMVLTKRQFNGIQWPWRCIVRWSLWRYSFQFWKRCLGSCILFTILKTWPGVTHIVSNFENEAWGHAYCFQFWKRGLRSCILFPILKTWSGVMHKEMAWCHA